MQAIGALKLRARSHNALLDIQATGDVELAG